MTSMLKVVEADGGFKMPDKERRREENMDLLQLISLSEH